MSALGTGLLVLYGVAGSRQLSKPRPPRGCAGLVQSEGTLDFFLPPSFPLDLTSILSQDKMSTYLPLDQATRQGQRILREKHKDKKG